VQNPVNGPLAVQLESEDRTGGWIELSVAYPHEGWEGALKAAMVDLDADFGFGRLGKFVFVADGPGLLDLNRESPVQLGIRNANRRIANLDVVAELEAAAFLSEAPQGPAFAHRSDRPKVFAGAAIHLTLVQNDLLSVELYGARFQNAV
jgi:hypothetical protein